MQSEVITKQKQFKKKIYLELVQLLTLTVTKYYY